MMYSATAPVPLPPAIRRLATATASVAGTHRGPDRRRAAQVHLVDVGRPGPRTAPGSAAARLASAARRRASGSARRGCPRTPTHRRPVAPALGALLAGPDQQRDRHGDHPVRHPDHGVQRPVVCPNGRRGLGGLGPHRAATAAQVHQPQPCGDGHPEGGQPERGARAQQDAVRFGGPDRPRRVVISDISSSVCAALPVLEDNTVPSLVVIEQFSRLTRNRLEACTEPTSDCEIGVTSTTTGCRTCAGSGCDRTRRCR